MTSGWSGQKVEITTNCPQCGQSFSREIYVEGVIPGCVLDICPSCCERMGGMDTVIIELTKRYDAEDE